MVNIMSKILGITAMSIGLTRAILNIENFGYPSVFSQIVFYFHIGLWILGIFAFIGGEKT